ncbi:MAG TPA: cell division protein ZapA [Tetragenococcus sp.]|nr:cell division protein ZapA [Tetragenococcus sp.]
MAKQKNRFKAVIDNQSYTIIGKEDSQHMKMVTALVNNQLKEIKELSPQTTSEQAAILLAVNAVSDQLKKQEQLLEVQAENEDLHNKAIKVVELENRIQRIEKIEAEAKAVLAKQEKKDVGVKTANKTPEDSSKGRPEADRIQTTQD